MSKEIDLIKEIIKEIDKNLYVDYSANIKIKVTNELAKLLLKLDTPKVRYFFENYNQDKQIADLQAIISQYKEQAKEMMKNE